MSGKRRWKKWSHLFSFHVPFLIYGPKIVLKSEFFCNLMLTSARNLSLFKQFTYMHPKGLITHFQKIVSFIMLWHTVSKILKVWSRRILLNYCWVSIFFDILIANISWTVAQTPINHILFWKNVMRTFRCIYTSCFNRLRYLAETSTKWTKMDFFEQFKDHKLARKPASWSNDPIFLSTFSTLTVCNIHFCFWK